MRDVKRVQQDRLSQHLALLAEISGREVTPSVGCEHNYRCDDR